MTRYQALLEIYKQQDTIYAGMLMLSIWAAGFGQLLDVMIPVKAHFIVDVFWGLVVSLFVAGLVFILVSFS
jgi:hypothetical protein